MGLAGLKGMSGLGGSRGKVGKVLLLGWGFVDSVAVLVSDTTVLVGGLDLKWTMPC